MNIVIIVGIVVIGVLACMLIRANRQITDRGMESLKGEFAELAARYLEGKANDLTRRNAEQVKPLFDQIKEQLNAAKKATDDAVKEAAASEARIVSKMSEVGEKAAGLGKAADEFVTALKGGNKIQGNWGEGILDQALTDAGLTKGVNYFAQTGTQNAGLPDVTVLCGEHKKLVIDAKVNINDFLEAARANQAGDRQRAEEFMKRHASSVRAQIKGLAEREYPKLLHAKDQEYEYAATVIMFMPSEATYAAAVNADVTLIAYALGLKILLCSPSMLFGYLAAIKQGLVNLETAKNQQRIIDEAHLIVDRMGAAFKTLEDVGKALETAQEKYHSALGKLGDGTNAQSVLVPAKRLAQMAEYRGKLPLDNVQ